MTDDFKDIVAAIQESKENQPTTIRIEEIAAGRLPQGMKPRDRQREFNEALTKWYADTEPQVSNI